jgi:hypothetical protein
VTDTNAAISEYFCCSASRVNSLHLCAAVGRPSVRTSRPHGCQQWLDADDVQYGCDIDRTIEKARQAAEGTKLFVLQNESIRLGDVTFAGATLWTDFGLFGDQRRAMAVAGERMNDFKKIRCDHYRDRFRPQHALARHVESRAFFEAEMRNPRGGPLVAFSHHAPHPGRFSRGMASSGFQSDEDVLTAAYCSDLTSLMWPAPIENGRNALRPADPWIFGHTHESVDTIVGATRLVSNAEGYGPWAPGETTWENPNFDPNYVIEI